MKIAKINKINIPKLDTRGKRELFQLVLLIQPIPIVSFFYAIIRECDDLKPSEVYSGMYAVIHLFIGNLITLIWFAFLFK